MRSEDALDDGPGPAPRLAQMTPVVHLQSTLHCPAGLICMKHSFPCYCLDPNLSGSLSQGVAPEAQAGLSLYDLRLVSCSS